MHTKKKITLFLLTALFGAWVFFDIIATPKKINSTTVVLEKNITAKKAESLIIQEIHGSEIWASNGYSIYKSSDGGNSFERQCVVPVHMVSYLSNSKILRNLVGIYKYMEFEVLNSGTYLAFASGGIKRSQDKGRNFETVSELGYFGNDMSREGRITLHQAITEDKQGNVYYGEYGMNPDREDVYIWQSKDDGKTWEKYYTFKAGRIRHIHALQYDSYSDSLWIGTGDSDKECIIGYFNKNDNSFQAISSGKQDSRAVSFIFTKDYVYWGKDSPDVQNFIYRYNRKLQVVEKIQAISGPAYYSTVLDTGQMFIGTTVENGKGEWDNMIGIWKAGNGKQWKRVLSVSKKTSIKKHGQVRFPRDYAENELIVTFFNTDSFNNSMLIINGDSIK
jgi:hypothetical protein